MTDDLPTRLADAVQEIADLRAERDQLAQEKADAQHELLERVKASAAAAALLGASTPASTDGA